MFGLAWPLRQVALGYLDDSREVEAALAGVRAGRTPRHFARVRPPGQPGWRPDRIRFDFVLERPSGVSAARAVVEALELVLRAQVDFVAVVAIIYRLRPG